MTDQRDRYYLFDTGPLLAFAGVARGPTLLKGRYAGQAGRITDVRTELEGLRYSDQPAVAAAAKVAVRSYDWLEDHTIEDEEGLAEVERTQLRLQTYKRRKDRLKKGQLGRRDWGESATLVLAGRLVVQDTTIIVANEDAARDLADDDGIPHICAVDILKATVRDGDLGARQAFKLYRDMCQQGLDPGDVLRGPGDL